jgi:hypothetical protein
MSSLSLPNLATLRLVCDNFKVAIDLISMFRPVVAHTLSIKAFRTFEQPPVSLRTDHLGSLLFSVHSISWKPSYREIPYIRNLIELAPNVRVLSVDVYTPRDPLDLREDGCLTITQLCSGLMPGNDGIPFPCLENFKGELLVLYFDEEEDSNVHLVAEGMQNLDQAERVQKLGEAVDGLFGRIQYMLLELLKVRRTAGAVPLQLLDLSVRPNRNTRHSGRSLHFKVSFQATAITE